MSWDDFTGATAYLALARVRARRIREMGHAARVNAASRTDPMGGTMPKLDVEQIFKYHPPHGDQQERYVALREKAKELAVLIQTTTPESREQSVALTNLQQTVMWANAAIAINEKA